jgi:hypothetical protein
MAATDMHATTEKMLEVVFSVRPVEAGSNTFTVALRVVGGDERKPSSWGYNQATLFLGDINTGTWPSRLEESRI